MGLTGQSLRMTQLLLVVLPAFVLFGYNQSGVGGLLSLRDWNNHFPQINTIDAKGAEKSHKSTVQGAVVATFTIGALFGPRPTKSHLRCCGLDPHRRNFAVH
jgi:hypothetical protein